MDELMLKGLRARAWKLDLVLMLDDGDPGRGANRMGSITLYPV
jgi:hypothetical protein